MPTALQRDDASVRQLLRQLDHRRTTDRAILTTDHHQHRHRQAIERHELIVQ